MNATHDLIDRATPAQLAALLAIAFEPEVRMPLPTTRQLIKSLKSELCPVCAGKKKPRHTLCGKCYFKMPAELRNATYAPVGEGYAEAVQDAFIHHDITEPHWPEDV